MLRSRPLAALAVLAWLALPHPAAARKFQMSGSWISRNGSFFMPLQFAYTLPGTQMTHVSMGNLTYALGFPNGPILGQGGVTATGSAPATLRIPRHRFVEEAMALVPFNNTNLIQVTTNIGLDAPYASATLAPGAGPGSFTWCPTDPACITRGGMLPTDPPQGGGPRNGRVIYRAGANQFGGVMQLGLRGGGAVSFPFGSPPLRAAHTRFAGVGTTLRNWAVGGRGLPDVPATAKAYLPRGFVTQPTMFPPMGSPILYPGPKVTTMLGTTLTGTGPIFYLHGVSGPMGTPLGRFTTRYGFAHTTGTVIVQLTIYSETFFTVMGSDARSPLGAGNISLVAGGIAFHNVFVNPTGVGYGSFDKVTLTLAPPIPSLSPAGAAAAVALVLLAAGYALRRRLG
jgi:hypothetical protein